MSVHLRPIHALLVAAAVLALPTAALAQTATLDAYTPSQTPEDDFALARPTDLGHLRFGAMLHLDYARNPLVWEDTLGDASTERLSIVAHELVGTVVLSLGLFDRLVVYGGLPVVLTMSGADASTVTGLGPRASDGTGLGDAYLGVRARLFGEEDDAFALGVQATLGLPSSGAGAYRGEESVSVRPELTAEFRPGGGLRIVANAGALVRGSVAQPTSNIVFGNALRLGLGVSFPVWTASSDAQTHLDLLAQLHAETAFSDLLGREATTSEALGGVRFAHASGLTVGAVAGPGLTRGVGSPDVRAVLMVGWALPREAPAPVDPCAGQVEDVDTYQDADGCPDPDNDGDGILDVDDTCPMVPETVNQWQDTDGCPDTIPDTVGDGLLDPNDHCPTEAEDRDGFQDEDGCPDPDNDGDGVLDVAPDQCPNEAGVADNHGCPDPDRDTDTVVDRRDNCPDVPGPVANYGCPAAEVQTVFISDGSLVIIETVYFRTDRDEILSRSFPLLANVAAVLTAHPEIAHIRVSGHTDNRGARAHNLDLSQRRAQSVVRHLVDVGHIDAARLTAVGYGPDHPVVADAHTPAEHAQNRRVVFEILSASDVTTTTTGPTSETIDR